LQLTITELDGGVRRVDLAGRLDIAGVGQVETRFTAAVGTHGGKVLVDLAGVDFLSSMGIRMLVASAKAAKGRGGSVVLCRPAAPVEQSLRDTGIDAILPIAKDETEGLSLLRG
jgi:anti-anti-sigma factor